MTPSETLIDIADDLKAMSKEPEAAALAGRLEDMAAELRRVARDVAAQSNAFPTATAAASVRAILGYARMESTKCP